MSTSDVSAEGGGDYLSLLPALRAWISRVQAALLLFLSVCLAPHAIGADDSLPSFQEVINSRLMAAEKAFGRDFEIIYDRTESSPGQPGASPYVGRREELSRSGDNWWRRSHYTKDLVTGATLSDRSRFEWIIDKQSLRLEGDWTAAIHDQNADNNMLRGLVFLRGVGADLYPFMYPGQPAPANVTETYQGRNFPYFSRGLAAASNGYIPQQSSVSIEGQKCIIFRLPGVDEITVCPAYDYSVVARKLAWTKDGPRRVEVSNSDFKQFDRGVWLPRRQTVVEYPFPGETGGMVVNEPLHSSTYVLVKYSNDPKNVDFDPPVIQPGTTIVNHLSGDISKAHSKNAPEPFVVEARDARKLLGLKMTLWQTFALALLSPAIVASLYFLWFRKASGR